MKETNDMAARSLPGYDASAGASDSPFFEGYKAAALISLGSQAAPLAADTLVTMRADCNYIEGWLMQADMFAKGLTAKAGFDAWEMRQEGRFARIGYPPVRLRQGEDGKVHQDTSALG